MIRNEKVHFRRLVKQDRFTYSSLVMQYDTWSTPTYQKDITQSRPISDPTLMLGNLHMKNALLCWSKSVFPYFPPLPFCYYYKNQLQKGAAILLNSKNNLILFFLLRGTNKKCRIKLIDERLGLLILGVKELLTVRQQRL